MSFNLISYNNKKIKKFHSKTLLINKRKRSIFSYNKFNNSIIKFKQHFNLKIILKIILKLFKIITFSI